MSVTEERHYLSPTDELELAVLAAPGREESSPRAWLAARSGWIGIAGLILCGTVIAFSAAQTPLLRPQSLELALPKDYGAGLTGMLGRHGIDLHLGGLIAVLIVMFMAYALAVRGSRQLSARAVLIAIGGLSVLILLAPPLLSTDVFSYAAYARMGAMYGSNPYLHGPTAIQLDHVYAFIGQRWVATPTVYGPLFTAFSYLLAPLSVAASVLAYKGIAVISSLVILLVVWRAAKLRGLDPIKAAVLVGLNPVTLVYGIGGGHNDLLMTAILLLSVYALLRARERTSGALIVTAIGVKLTAGLLLPFAFAQTLRRGEDSGRGRAVLIGAAIVGALVVGLSFAVFGTGTLRMVTTLEQIQGHGGVNSVSGVILHVLGLHGLSSAVGLVLDAAFFGCVAWLVRRVWTGELDWVTAAGWATVALLVTAGLLLPWYVGWLVPLAALSRDRRLLMTSVALTGIALTSL